MVEIDTNREWFALINLVIGAPLLILVAVQWYIGHRARQRIKARYRARHGARAVRALRRRKRNLHQFVRFLNVITICAQLLQSWTLFAANRTAWVMRSIGGDFAQFMLFVIFYCILKRYLQVALMSIQKKFAGASKAFLVLPLALQGIALTTSSVLQMTFDRKWYEFFVWWAGGGTMFVWILVCYKALSTVSKALSTGREYHTGATDDKHYKPIVNAKRIFFVLCVICLFALPAWIYGGVSVLDDKDRRFFRTEDLIGTDIIGTLTRLLGIAVLAWFGWTPMCRKKGDSADGRSDSEYSRTSRPTSPSGKRQRTKSTQSLMRNSISQTSLPRLNSNSSMKLPAE